MTTKQTYHYAPNYAVVPGETLAETLAERRMTQAELARRTNRPLKTINEIVNGKAAITPETAIQLERVLGVAATFWTKLELDYRTHIALAEERQRLEAEIGWLDQFPVKEMVKRKLIPHIDDRAGTMSAVLGFFGVSTTSAWARKWSSTGALFRQSTAYPVSEGAVAVWLRWGELKAAQVPCKPYDPANFLSALALIRGLTTKEPQKFEPALKSLCAEAGVAVVFVPEIGQTRASGATRWLTSDLAVIQLSLRYRKDDHFWFTFFEEGAHVILHGRRDFFIGGVDSPTDATKEAEAKRWAAEFLIPQAGLDQFVTAGSITEPSIKRFARELGIAPGIVVGRLQHDGHLSFPTPLNRLKQTFILVE
jgi:addiction module HigA family antidote